MHKVRLRYYLYIAAGVPVLIFLLTDQDLSTFSRIAALFHSLTTLSRSVFSGMP
jgi:hypothetical protein